MVIYKDVAAESNGEQHEVSGIDDIDEKEKSLVALVGKAVSFFKKNSITHTCRAFIHDPVWRQGELFIYVLDKNGAILCYGDNTAVLFEPINRFDKTKINIFSQIQRAAEQGNWLNYMWQNGFQSAYVQKVEKDGSPYYLAAGFYPESQEYIAKQLVNLAVAYVQRHGISAVVSEINNAQGQFVKGEVSLALFDYKGNMLANPEAYGLVGQNVSKIVDERGVPLVEADIAIARNRRGSGWRNARWKNTTYRRYIQRVTDPKSKQNYYIVGGYYPDVGRQDMIGFVHRAISHLKGAGPKEAFADFNNTVGDYVKGPLSIFVYDFNGISLADGEHPHFVGRDLLDRKDVEGTYIVQKIIAQAKKYGKGSFTYIDRNAYKTIYFEVVTMKIDKKTEQFIVGSGYYPSSKHQTVQAMVYKAEAHIQRHPLHRAFDDFSNPTSEFFRGDVFVFALTPSGIQLTNGTDTNSLWKNFSDLVDNKGRNIIPDIISIAQAGGGWASYKIGTVERRVYTRQIEKYDEISKTTEKVIIGSQYFL